MMKSIVSMLVIALGASVSTKADAAVVSCSAVEIAQYAGFANASVLFTDDFFIPGGTIPKVYSFPWDSISGVQVNVTYLSGARNTVSAAQLNGRRSVYGVWIPPYALGDFSTPFSPAGPPAISLRLKLEGDGRLSGTLLMGYTTVATLACPGTGAAPVPLAKVLAL